MKRNLRFFLLLLALGLESVAADLEATTADGRRVILHEDHTWEYSEIASGEADSPEKPEYVLLRVVRREPDGNGCRIGLKLENRMESKIKSLVPQFSAYNEDDTLFETVFESFTHIRPTEYQYQEIRFDGIDCAEISLVKVHGADRCVIAELHKYSPQKGACLARIRVESSDLVRISK